MDVYQPVAMVTECKIAWASRYKRAKDGHLEIGCRGINPFQASGLLSYECALTLAVVGVCGS